MKQMKLYAFGKFFAMAAIAGAIAAGCEEKGSDIPYKSTPYAYIGSDNECMPTGGTISVEFSDAPRGCEIGMLVDNDYNTKFVTSHKSFNLIWNGDGSVAVLSYSLVSANDCPECDPVSWTLSGSPDNKSWKTLDTQSGVVFSERGELKKFEISNTTAYKYYRLKIRDNKGSENTQIAEWGLQVAEGTVEFVDIRDRLPELMALASGWSNSDVTPMGNRFEKAREATADDLAWLANASENPPVEAAGIGGNWISCPVNLYPYGSPVPADVNQHAIGDCCMCAVFASLAYMHPDFIKNIIKVNGSTYKVTMYNPKGEPITVAVNNEFICDGNGNISQLSGKNNTACWSTIMEKALMKYEYVYRVDYPIGGIGTEWSAPPFTGCGDSFAFSPESLTPDQMSRVAKTVVDLGYIAICGFRQNDVIVDDPFKSVSAHAFTVMYPQKSGALFACRNPWGGAAGSPDGKEDGVMNIWNDGTVPQLIDFRIVYPGKASDFPKRGVGPYTPPSFSQRSFWLAPHLSSFYGLDSFEL